MNKNQILSAKEIAYQLNTTPRIMRKYLRDDEGGIGRGNRYAIDSNDFIKIKKSFLKWAKENQIEMNQIKK